MRQNSLNKVFRNVVIQHSFSLERVSQFSLFAEFSQKSEQKWKVTSGIENLCMHNNFRGDKGVFTHGACSPPTVFSETKQVLSTSSHWYKNMIQRQRAHKILGFSLETCEVKIVFSNLLAKSKHFDYLHSCDLLRINKISVFSFSL